MANPIDGLSSDQLAAVFEQASNFTTWALSIGAGSVAILVGTSHISPSGKWRLMYLFFLPAWACLGLVVYYSDQISRNTMAGHLSKTEFHGEILKRIANNYDGMHLFFVIATGFLTIWLLWYLVWWVFGREGGALI